MTSQSPQVAVIDYGMGNLHSVQKALESVGLEAEISSSPQTIEEASAVVLPGVGAFGDAMDGLAEEGILETTRARAVEAAGGGRPFLGICLGLQVLVERGEEPGADRGLGVFAGRCVRIPAPGLKVPHMGWNALRVHPAGDALFAGLPPEPYVYFVHSYHAVPDDPSLIAATTQYGGEVVAALAKGNLFATQFHPEKSQRVGMQILRNFASRIHEPV